MTVEKLAVRKANSLVRRGVCAVSRRREDTALRSSGGGRGCGAARWRRLRRRRGRRQAGEIWPRDMNEEA